MSLQIYDLTHTYGQFMPEWPSHPGVDIDVLKFHARDGVYEVNWEGIMHRGTHMDAPLHVTENRERHPPQPDGGEAGCRHRGARAGHRIPGGGGGRPQRG